MHNKMVELLSDITKSSLQITPDVLVLQFTIVNSCIVSNLGGDKEKWVLVDTGLENSAEFIMECAKDKFGEESRPEAIIITHGHFDHVGSVKKLSEYYDVPVYAHKLELPYITGKEDYPLADPNVDEGLVAKISKTFPHTSIDLGNRAKALPDDGSIPFMPGWIYIHTPGHCKGHIALFKKDDRILIAADAFSTLKQESLLSVITQKEDISGPPKYLTTDWDLAKKSIEKLLDLKPNIAITGHGKPMEGESLIKHLKYLLENFEKIAKPDNGKFID
ncbi:MBL fold metallo-hydrolase [Clostridium baratii]|uniref:MBL fold metallo-hydrolase n=1 Tax=Clostridium baratii TaxID=1561 RepID=UPI0009A29B06|nr:MBL fold metallo-hydrolase [Clostridium baratii]OPF50833.1 MBL fold metallo-hydrolase [Clostridium baratii]OPF54550.1 MBL fold metallo-hydrolase [Clostridium baratii]OPF54856.1 MBL fold metallo-hydrolase [Clostridium baratii]OPF59141.1 MBL fold metallo-hydrolase [Clostridium baratii]